MSRGIGRERRPDYFDGFVPLVDELDVPAPFVPDVPLVPEPDVPFVPEPDVPEVPLVLPEVDPAPLVPEVSDGVVPEAPVVPVALPDTELELLLGVEVVSVDDGVVVVLLGLVLVVDDELLGVEPELPLLPLLQPVAATEARAMTATRGIRRFMLLSPIRTCVEEVVLRGSRVLREAIALDARQRMLDAQPMPRLAPRETGWTAPSSEGLSCGFAEKVAAATSGVYLT